MMTRPKQKQGGQYRDAHGILTLFLVSADVVLVQSQPRCAFPMDQRNGPTLLVHAHHVSRHQLGQIGHQDFRVFGAHVTPLFPQHHSDITDMTQMQASAIRPKGLATTALGLLGNLGAPVQRARQVRDEILDHCIVNVYHTTTQRSSHRFRGESARYRHRRQVLRPQQPMACGEGSTSGAERGTPRA